MYVRWNVAGAGGKAALTKSGQSDGMMRPVFLFLFCMVFAACDTPGPSFRGIEPVRISVGKSIFDVRVDGNRAQAIRLNMEWAPRPAAVAPRAVAAIEQVSGCRVARLDGDQAVILARLEFGRGLAPPAPDIREFDCEIEPMGGGLADLVCTPVI